MLIRTGLSKKENSDFLIEVAERASKEMTIEKTL